MKLNLVYRLPSMKSLNVGIFSGKMIDLASNQKLIASGEIVSHLISTMCDKVPEELVELSCLDMIRVAMVAYRQTHFTDEFVNHSCVCECQYRHDIAHDLSVVSLPAEPNALYNTQHKIMAPHLETFEPIEYTFVLRPQTIARDAELIKSQNDENVAKEAILRHQIKSVNGSEDFDVYSLPLPVLQKIANLIKEDHDIDLLTTKTIKCERPGCELEVKSVISLENESFLA